MSESFVVDAEVRDDMGKGASRRLRRDGKMPGVLYGAGKDAVSITVDHNELSKHLEHEAFFSHILTVNLAGKAEKAVLKDLQRHPSKPVLLHVDFQRVSESEKLRMQVPLHFLNEEECPGVKAGGLATHNITEVEVSCLPKDLPEFIEVDLAGLDMDQSIHLSNLSLPAGVELVQLAHGAEHDLPVVSIHLTRGARDAAAASEEGEGENA